MTTPLRQPHVTADVQIPGGPVETLPVAGGSIILDALAVPYASGYIELPLTADLPAESFDPRDDARVHVSAAGGGHWDPGTPTYTPWTERRRNFVPSPRGVSLTGYASSTQGVLASIPAGGGVSFTRNATGSARVLEVRVGTGTAGRRVTIKGEVFTPTALSVVWRPATATSAGSISGEPVGPIPIAGAWQPFEKSVTTVTDSATAGFVFIADGTAGQVTQWRNLQVELSDAPLGPFFDGDTPDTDLTRYGWTGAANGSASTFEDRQAIPAVPVWTPDTPRVFDLGLRSRTIDHTAKRITGELASDEALLMDYSVLAVDSGARVHETSLRAVCDYVLGKIGAGLAAGADDANVSAYWDVVNLITNPSFETGTTGWAAGTGTSAATRITGAVPTTPSGSASLRWTASGTGAAFLSGTVHVAVIPGRSYVFSVYVLASAPLRTLQTMVRFNTSAGETIRDAYGIGVTGSTSAWTRIVQVVTAPAGAATANVHIRSTSNTAGQFHYADAVMFHEGTAAVPYFDGSTPASSTYTYEWSGETAHASPSRRIAVTPRDPDLYVWRPGTTAWQFLEPFLVSSGLRLFADERRVWRLIEPAAYIVPGLVSVTPGNATAGTDTISRDDAEIFATGVVCRYVWQDADGETRTGYDSAGTPGKVVVLDYARPYPGAGAAAAILARRNGSGRAQDVTALVDWTTTPGMEASVSLPIAPLQKGKVASVEFSLSDDALMRLGTRGLIDIPAGAIDLLPGTIDGLVGTIDQQQPAATERTD